MSQSMYVRATVYSAAAAGIFESRSSSRTASFLTSAGMPAASIFSRSSSISFAWSSPSPSSFWMAFICSRSRNSRWPLPTSDWTSAWIFEPSSRTSSSLVSSRWSSAIRARTSVVSSSCCLAAEDRVPRLDAMKSVTRAGSEILAASATKSSERTGESWTICWNVVRILRWSASISTASASVETSTSSLTSARRYGFSVVTRAIRRRRRPWTIRRRLPSGSLNILWMCVSVPTSCRSACPGSSTVGSRWVTTPMSLSPAMASSMSLIELSRATASGMNECGKRTVSRNGRSGTSAGTVYVRSPLDDVAWTSVMTTPDPSEKTNTAQAPRSAGPARWESPRCVREALPLLVQVQQEAG